MNEVKAAADILRSAARVVAITGAGISAESGVPTFRGPEGLWRAFRPEDLATPEAFARDPALVWEWYRWRRARIRGAQPNAGHLALARFEQRAPGFLLLTQNVDGLHRLAGSQSLIELHGNIWRSRCSVAAHGTIDERDDAGDGNAVLPRCACGALRRPDVVWFGEPLDPRAVGDAVQAVESCDAMLVIGTSAVVYPVASLPVLARQAGARIIEVNIDETPLTASCDVVIRQRAAVALPAIEAAQ